jgi:hypothetical protein
MNLTVLNQIFLFLPLYRPTTFLNGPCLYTRGSSRTLEDLVENVTTWLGPSVLLLSGRKSLKSADDASCRVILGVFTPSQWRPGFNFRFGSEDSLIFELAPVHKVFRATPKKSQFPAFTGDEAGHGGIGYLTDSEPSKTVSGPVSLSIDENLETASFAVRFEPGASYRPGSGLTASSDIQYEIDIDKIEVWGFKDAKVINKENAHSSSSDQ